MNGIKVRKTKSRGRGVYSTQRFSPGDVIERCPVIVLTLAESELCQKTIFDSYLFDWSHGEKSALPLGYGAIYNHSFSPNARYYFSHTRHLMIFKAIKSIRPGEEITVNYNFEPHDRTPLYMTDPFSRTPLTIDK